MLTALREVLADQDAPAGLAEAVGRLTERYRTGVDGGVPAMRSAIDRAAYIAARMPATATAVAAALRAGRARASAAWATVLDLGSGPGSALWAALDALDGVQALSAVERDDGLVALGRTLAAAGPDPLPATAWHVADLRAPPALGPHDLVTISYALGELDAAAQDTLVDAAWALAGDALAIIEPGTPRGAATVLRARARLIAQGAGLAAPCPHTAECPLARGDHAPGCAERTPGWCHFAVRLPRSRLHRAAKTASLGFEDEPFSYLVATRTPCGGPGARVIAPVRAHKGGVAYTACASDGLRAIDLPRRDPAWKAARDLTWGDWI